MAQHPRRADRSIQRARCRRRARWSGRTFRAARRASGFSSLAHIMGVVVSETTIETTIAIERVTANSRNRRPTMPPISRIGINTAISEMLMESTVKPISCAPLQRRLEGRHALLQIARDVLDHHDRVVHHEAGGDGQRHQRKIVEAVAAADTSPRTCRSARPAPRRWESAWPARCAGKRNTTRITSDDRDEQRSFDVVDRRANGHGAVQRHAAYRSPAGWRPAARQASPQCGRPCR